MEQIVFSKNWNNKLGCDFFTTIRLRNDAKYTIGKSYQVILKERGFTQDKGEHRVISIMNMLLKDVSMFTTMIDAGMTVPEFQSFFKTMYKTQPINWNRQEVSIILLCKVTVNQPQLAL